MVIYKPVTSHGFPEEVTNDLGRQLAKPFKFLTRSPKMLYSIHVGEHAVFSVRNASDEALREIFQRKRFQFLVSRYHNCRRDRGVRKGA